jgi:hypothetical protein
VSLNWSGKTVTDNHENNEEITMKSSAFASFSLALALLLLGLAPGVGAQTKAQNSPKITADVPFDFLVGQTIFPAGNYTLKPMQNRVFSLQAAHGKELVKFATEPIRAWAPSGSRLVFGEEDGHYRLREVWMNSATGVGFPGPGANQLTSAGESRVDVPATCTNCD